jgi:PAS domain S-box-containing protein
MTKDIREEIPEKEAAAFFWRLFEFNEFPIITWEEEGKIVNANEAFFKMTGYNNLDLEKKGLSWKELTPKEDVSAVEEKIKMLKEHTVTTPLQKRLIKKDGTQIQVVSQYAVRKVGDTIGVAVIMPA